MLGRPKSGRLRRLLEGAPLRLAPDRLNLAIARRCDVACAGCYTVFGHLEPNLPSFLSAAREFARLGVVNVTISGGDPLNLPGLMDFMSALRTAGVKSIKLDTVGVGLVSAPRRTNMNLVDLLKGVDFLGIPLDGWSDASVLQFRRGRSHLYSETIELLRVIDTLRGPPKLIINTVAHRNNVEHLERIRDELVRHSSVCHWNVFQYTATDQANDFSNMLYSVDDQTFEIFRTRMFAQVPSDSGIRTSVPFEFRTSRSRLGQYLLVNSDGEAWLPDEVGKTVRLGSIFGRETEILEKWSHIVTGLVSRPPSSLSEASRIAK
jgi:MoaA/NifB/PqqE/SkfB family radical SAM enzyme